VKSNLSDNKVDKDKAVEKPVVAKIEPIKEPEKKEAKVIDSSNFPEYLHYARLNLAAFNREKALKSLKMASDWINKHKEFKPDSVIMLKMEFANKGFASTPTYLILDESHKDQIIQIINDVKVSNQELLSISLMKPTKSLVSKEVVQKLNDSVKALEEINPAAPDYDFAIADRAIRDIYKGWKVVPYDNNSIFETKYYLNVAEVLVDQKNLDLAEDLLDSAHKSYSRKYPHNVFNSRNHDFISYYKSTSKNLKQTIDRNKKVKKNVNKGVLEYLF
jgi:tetratricopeptide (TPR) repeat protein